LIDNKLKNEFSVKRQQSNVKRVVRQTGPVEEEDDSILRCPGCGFTYSSCQCDAGADDLTIPDGLNFDLNMFMGNLDSALSKERAYDPDRDPPIYVEISGYKFIVELWKPGMPVIHDEIIAVDTETELLESGAPIKPVLLQACSLQERKIQVAQWPHFFEYWYQLFNENMDTEWVFHNAPFDCDVVGLYRNKELLTWLLETLTSRGTRRITDTSIRYVMYALKRGTFYGSSKLSIASKALLGEEIDKEAVIRHTFYQGMELCHDHLVYACKDAAVTLLIRMMMRDEFPTEFNTTRAYFALRDISNNGMQPDVDYLKELQDKFSAQLAEYSGYLACWGYRPGHTGVQKVCEETMQVLEKQAGVRFSRTEKEQLIQVGAQAEEIYKDAGKLLPKFIWAYNHHKHSQKISSTYLKSSYIGKDGRVHSYFNPIVKTGRTSSSKPNMQNFPREENIRGIYVAPDGHVLYACDYSQLELCALAQACWVRFKYSKMKDVINSGEDLHMWFGMKIKDLFMESELSRILIEFRQREKRDPRPDEIEILKQSIECLPDPDYRQQAKACNFGYPGGLGTDTFITWAKNTYGQTFTPGEANKLRALWLESFPEMEYHLKGVEDKFHRGKDGETRFIGSTIHGRERADCGYCDSLNYQFQGVAADGAKNALWYLFKEGFKTVNFIHDEVIEEFAINEKLQIHCRRVDELMVHAMREFIPDVLIEVEGALMYRWDKNAKPLKDSHGDTVIWTPELGEEIAKAKDKGEKFIIDSWLDYVAA
jgi:DNA polymerase I-like protein with 3'-5' exonuclease and polymerase domains